MKANKTLKRLTKIEALLSDIRGRHSTKASDLRQVLQDAGAAIVRAKEIVSSQAAAKVNRKAKRAAPTRKKVAVKKASSRAAVSKSAKKSASRKKVAKEKAATMTASASAPILPESSGASAIPGEVD